MACLKSIFSRSTNNARNRAIDLSKQNLDEIPRKTFYGNIEELTINHNRIEDLPALIGRMGALKKFSIADNRLQALPKEIGKLTNLIVLNIGENRIQRLPDEIGQLKNLTKFIGSLNQLVELPSTIGVLHNLVILNLEYNRLCLLPNELMKLPSLTNLNLHGNQIIALPNQISCLTKLSHLNITLNRLTELPAEIGYLTNLETLKAPYNELDVLPDTIQHLSNLNELVLAGNKITVPSKGIMLLSNLKKLVLAKNRISSLLPEIENLKSLTHLDLRNNILCELPKTMSSLAALTYLDLQNNLLKSLNIDIFSNLKYLKFLCASSNQVKSIHVDFFRVFYQLRQIDLSVNEIDETEQFPDKLYRLARDLHELNIAGNALCTFPKSITTLTNITSLNLSMMPKMAPGGIPSEVGRLVHLKHFKYGYANVDSIPPEFAGLQSMETLFLAGNALEFFPELLCRFSNLEELYLGYNRISAIPESFTQLRNLKKFDIQGNLIQVFPSEICSEMENLFELDLSNNMLKAFSTRGLSRLRNLKLRNCETLEVVDIVDCKALVTCCLENNPNLYLNSVPKQFMHFVNFSYYDCHRVTFINAASSDMSGMRAYMEDVSILQTHLDFTQHNKKKFQFAEFAYCAVFDGHAGNDASLYSGRRMHKLLMEKLERLKKTGNTDSEKFHRSQSNNSLSAGEIDAKTEHARSVQSNETESKLPIFHHSDNLTSTKIKTILYETFLEMHTQLCSDQIAGGTTAAVALFSRSTQKVYLAHVGDSKIIVLNNTSVLYESIDHKPLILRSELDRIIHDGGHITDDLYVNNVVNMTRSLGDVIVEKYVIAEPTIIEIDWPVDRPEMTQYRVVLASDGLFDVFKVPEVVDIVRAEPDVVKASAKLRDYAYLRGGTDNITVAVIAGVVIEDVDIKTSSVLDKLKRKSITIPKTPTSKTNRLSVALTGAFKDSLGTPPGTNYIDVATTSDHDL